MFKINPFCLVGFVFTCFCCNPIPDTEHTHLSFENNSDYDIALEREYGHEGGDPYYSQSDGSYPFSDYGSNGAAHCVDSKTTNYNVMPLRRYSFERLFNNIDSYIVYVFPKRYTREEWEAIGKPKWDDVKLVSYELTLNNLIELDSHLSFPPDERMKKVKMDPEYEPCF